VNGAASYSSSNDVAMAGGTAATCAMIVLDVVALKIPLYSR
jgi:hypothetical protein